MDSSLVFVDGESRVRREIREGDQKEGALDREMLAYEHMTSDTELTAWETRVPGESGKFYEVRSVGTACTHHSCCPFYFRDEFERLCASEIRGQ